MSLVDELRKLIGHPAPGFRCHTPVNQGKRKYVARVAHLLADAADEEQIREIKRRLKSLATPVANFFARHNGFTLYRDLLSDAAGVRLLPVHEWDNATAELKQSVGHIPKDADPANIKGGLPIAEIPHSGNYLVMSLKGASAGRVFYADHDGWYAEPFAQDFDGFIRRLCKNPVLLLNETFGCYARYSDGKSDTQWIPEMYFSDFRKA